MDERMERIIRAADHLRSLTGTRKPRVGIVLGSGLGKLAEKIEEPLTVPYRDIPGFPVSTAIGHKGNFIFGRLGGKEVVAMQGRFHYYEGYTAPEISRLLGKNVNTIYTNLARARERLKELLGGEVHG